MTTIERNGSKFVCVADGKIRGHVFRTGAAARVAPAEALRRVVEATGFRASYAR